MTKAVLLDENVGDDGSYSGTFKAYGLTFTVSCSDAKYFELKLTAGDLKRPGWWVEAAGRLCQSAAYERVKALGLAKE